MPLLNPLLLQRESTSASVGLSKFSAKMTSGSAPMPTSARYFPARLHGPPLGGAPASAFVPASVVVVVPASRAAPASLAVPASGLAPASVAPASAAMAGASFDSPAGTSPTMPSHDASARANTGEMI